MIPADTITRRAWANYLERNRRANVQYDRLPLAHGHHNFQLPCHLCDEPTAARSGVCGGCTSKTERNAS